MLKSYLTTIFVFFALLLFPSYLFAAEPAKRILILNSYHQGYTWGDNETAGIVKSLKDSGLNEPLIEYLDTKRLSKKEHYQQLRDLLRVKLALYVPDLVMTLDDPALDFAVTYRKELFSGVPVVFVGVNSFNPKMLRGEEGITGAVERQDFIRTARVALELQPDTKDILVVHDYTFSGLETWGEVKDQLAPLRGKVTLRHLPDLTIDEVVAELKKLSPGTVVLGVSFSRDKSGRLFNHDEVARILSSASPVPVYSTKVERLGHGIVGGSLMEGAKHGSQGAKLALRILKGTPPEQVPVLDPPVSDLMFDYTQLVRHAIPLSRLPADSRLINKPESYYAEHRQVINVSLVIILILTGSFCAVLIEYRRRLVAEKALFESERYRTLFDNANDPLFILDLQGTILEVNSVAEKLLRRESPLILQQPLHSLLVQPDSEAVCQYLQAVMQTGQGVVQAEITTPDRILPVEVSSRKIVYHETEAILSAVRDISERIAHEAEMKELNTQLEVRIRERTLELEVAIRELESFSYSVSHDLQAPLRHINSFCSILTEDHAASLDDDAHNYLNRICRASRRMGQLIDDLLNLSRVSRQEMHRVPTNLSKIAHEILDDLALHYPERQVACQVEENLIRDVDPQLIRIALTNLLENAWKYTSRTASACIEFGAGVTDKGPALYVRDNGAGFNMKYVGKLFTPFQRLHPDSDFPGTGIGLATVARVVHRHGGKVWVEAEEGEGATFRFTLGKG